MCGSVQLLQFPPAATKIRFWRFQSLSEIIPSVCRFTVDVHWTQLQKHLILLCVTSRQTLCSTCPCCSLPRTHGRYRGIGGPQRRLLPGHGATPWCCIARRRCCCRVSFWRRCRRLCRRRCRRRGRFRGCCRAPAKAAVQCRWRGGTPFHDVFVVPEGSASPWVQSVLPAPGAGSRGPAVYVLRRVNVASRVQASQSRVWGHARRVHGV